MNIFSNYPPDDELSQLGRDMRAHAIKDPCYIPTDCADPRYSRTVAHNYHVTLTLECFENPPTPDGHQPCPPPRWHGSVSILKDVVSGDDKTFGFPTEQRLLLAQAWDKDDLYTAREILGHVLGPVILEETQPIREMCALFGMHWETIAHQQTMSLVTH
jgi:hypothetical protein